MNRYFGQSHAAGALAVGAIAFATIAGAWIFQALGYPPCDLCSEQRYAYYVGVPVAVVVFALAKVAVPRGIVVAGLIALALIFAANAVLAGYHSGVEAGLWQGPTACTGALADLPKGNLLEQLRTSKVVVRCDAVSLRVFGLSLANWNILISAALAAIAARAVFSPR